MHLRRLEWVLALLAVALPPGCGARSGLPGEELVRCAVAADCPATACETAECVAGVCELTPLRCDDGDPCTDDRCEPDVGCIYRPRTDDADGDGHRAPLAGFAPGEPGACGDDCDDRNALAHPGRTETCDGLDNDCNGVIDDGARYGPSGEAPVRISASALRAYRGDLAASKEGFVLTYAGLEADDTNLFRPVFVGLDVTGRTRFTTRVTETNVSTFPGPLAWDGQAFASAWSDARMAGGYEIYFALFSADGKKLGPDVRLTEAAGFSLNPAIVWNRSEYVVIWDDRRDEGALGGEAPRLYAQRLGADGRLLGGNVLLSEEAGLEYPTLAQGTRRLGLAHTVHGEPSRLGFRVLDARLAEAARAEELLGANVTALSLHALDDRFVLLWEEGNEAGPGNALYAAVFDEDARLVVPATTIASGASFLRSHAARSFGDRFIVVWADDTHTDYELFVQTFGPDLVARGERARLTNEQGDSVNPAIALGPEGTLGVLFEDFRTGTRHVYFLTLACTD
ncbi:MAG: putative metal-binding motif-containing protein [Pseudomonadota bacterium]